MKFSLLAALTIGCLAGSTNLITDEYGNRGIGEGNIYEGSGNNWIGNRNNIHGVDNGVKGDDNTVHGINNQIDGDVNNVTGKENHIIGGQNKIIGQNNIVHGTGNVIGASIGDIPFDIQSRLPAWMRSKIPKSSNNQTKNTNQVIGQHNKVTGQNNKVEGTGNIVVNSTSNLSAEIKNKLPLWMKNKVAERQLSQIQTPQQKTTTSTSETPLVPINTEVPIVHQTNQSNKTDQTIPIGPIVTSPITPIPTVIVPSPPDISIIPQIPIIPLTLPPIPQNPNIQDVSQYQIQRKPSYRQVIKSPKKTQIRQVYITPNSRQQVISSFPPELNSFPERRNSVDWNQNKEFQWNRQNDWKRINNAWNPIRINDLRGINPWGMGANNWNRAVNPTNLYYPPNPLVQHRWNNNDLQNWGTQIRSNTDRSVQDLRSRIQSQVQQSIDRAFGRTFY